MSYKRRNRWSALFPLLVLVPFASLYPFFLGVNALPIDAVEMLRDSIILSAFVFAVLFAIVVMRSKIREVVYGPAVMLFALWMATGFIVTWDLNARLDRSPLMSVIVEVSKVEKFTGLSSKLASCQLEVPSWRPGEEWERIMGNAQTCTDAEAGKPLEILFHNGFFGYPWVESARTTET